MFFLRRKENEGPMRVPACITRNVVGVTMLSFDQSYCEYSASIKFQSIENLNLGEVYAGIIISPIERPTANFAPIATSPEPLKKFFTSCADLNEVCSCPNVPLGTA